MLRAGYAAVDITPPAGTELTGFIAREGPSTGTLDPLEARALVVEDEAGRRAALVTCDLVGLGRHLVRRVRERVAASTPIAPGAQLYNCSHTHSGPETGVLTTIGLPNPGYLAELDAKIAEAVIEAARDLAPVALRTGTARVPSGLVVNRVRRRLGEGHRFDEQLTAAQLVREQWDTPLATVVSFACHAVSLGHGEREASADFVGPLRHAVEAAGAGPVLYVNGCGGDVNPASMDRRGREARDDLAAGLAAASHRALSGARKVDSAAVDWRVGWAQELAPLPLQALRTPHEAAELLDGGRKRQAALPPGSPGWRAAQVAEVEYPLRLLRLHYGSEPLPDFNAEVQALRLGPLAVVGLPGEIFNSLGQRIRAESPFGPERTVIAGWTNDNVGYVPDRETYPLGGYEVDSASRYYGFPAGWAPEAGDNLVAAAGRLLAQLHSGDGGLS